MANAKKLDCTWPKARLEPRRLRVADDYLQGVLDGKNFLVFDGAMGTQPASCPSFCASPTPKR